MAKGEPMSDYIWMLVVTGTALLALNFFSLYRKSIQRRLNLESYAIYLLLNDDIRENHKEKFKQWIAQATAKNAFDLAFDARNAIADIANRLADDSVLAASAMVWKEKGQTS
jgi:hypothetical protein